MLRYLLPLGIFIVLVVFLAIGLELDPREVPSPLISKPAPAFSLPALDNPQQAVAPSDYKGKIWLLNVWASWCVSCRVEHPVLNELSRSGEVILIGLNYKDTRGAAQQWLQQRGNPYTVSAFDADGRAGIDWGVYGVPETFVIDRQGLIRHKHTGPVSRQDLKEKILPLVYELMKEPPV